MLKRISVGLICSISSVKEWRRISAYDRVLLDGPVSKESQISMRLARPSNFSVTQERSEGLTYERGGEDSGLSSFKPHGICCKYLSKEQFITWGVK